MLSVVGAYTRAMGFFTGPKVSPSEKVRVKAAKAGVDLSGAWGVGHQFVGGQDSYLGVFPDRVEVYRVRKVGGLRNEGAGVDVYPVSAISSAHLTKDGHWWVLVFTAHGVVVNFRGGEVEIQEAHQALMRAMAEHASA